MRSKRWLPDLGALLVLLVLPLLLFWPVTIGSKTLLPADNLYQWEPYRSFAGQQGVPLPPQNELLSDLVLENLVWKQFIVQSIENRELPLWNPHLFAGAPFLAAGQHSALYPLSAIFYVLPLDKAYGLFTVLQLWMAGVFMYLFGRTLRMGPFPALIAGIVYQLSAFFLVSVVFTMIIAAAAWLPLLLAIIEIMIRKQEEKGAGPFVPIIYVVIGAIALGVHVLAGHPEILVYTLMVMALYALVRLLMLWRRVGTWRPALRLGLWLAFMAGLGLGLGSVQLIPLFELVTRNFREGSVTYSDVVGWAYPTRQVLTFLLPDFFGNPAHHGYWDLVSRQWVDVDRIFWGIKNYVEAGSYVGILPLLLALVAVVPVKRRLGGTRPSEDRRHVWIFAALAVVSLLFVFGTPLYALLYYGLPGIKQLHSPFRWVFPYTLSIAVLAGFGARRLMALRRDYGVDKDRTSLHPEVYRPWISLLTWGALGGGLLLLAGLLLVFLAPGTFVPLADRVLAAVEKAQEAFTSGQMFLSYQWLNLFIFALMLTASGIVLRVSRCPIYLPLPRALNTRLGDARIPLWQLLAVVAVALDLLLFGWGFNPAADPAWLEFTPPSIEFLQQQAAADEASASGNPWRLTTYRPAESTKTLNPNIPWYQGLEDIRGYDSIIPAQYVGYMRAIEGQGELLYNHIAPVYGPDNLNSPLLDLLGVRYVMTEGQIPNAGFQLVYDDEVRIYENTDVMPRAFALPRVQVTTEARVPINCAPSIRASSSCWTSRPCPGRYRSSPTRPGPCSPPASLPMHPTASLWTSRCPAPAGCSWPIATSLAGRHIAPICTRWLRMVSSWGPSQPCPIPSSNRPTRPSWTSCGLTATSGPYSGGGRAPGPLQVHADELQAGVVRQLYGGDRALLAGALLAVGPLLPRERRRSRRQTGGQEQPAAHGPAVGEPGHRFRLRHAHAAHPGPRDGRALHLCRCVHRLL